MSRQKKKNNNPQTAICRLRLLAFVVMCCWSLIAGRMAFLQVVDGPRLRSEGDARIVRYGSIPATRGAILDRDGDLLAVSIPVVSVVADPQTADLSIESINRLASAIEKPVSEVQQQIARKQRRFVYLAKNLPLEKGMAVSDLGLPGIRLESGYRRYYPEGPVTAHVLGITGADDKGLEGTELSFDEYLTGRPGQQRMMLDRKGRMVDAPQVVEPAMSGNDLQLTIDVDVQRVLYNALAAAVHEHKALSATAVVVDVADGGVLGMGSYPAFNPNDAQSRRKDPALRRNRAVTDVFEPGSVIKPVTVAAALEYGPYTLNSTFDTDPGYMRVQRKTIRDHHNYGTLDFRGVIQKSSNVAVSRMALEMGDRLVRDVFGRMGVGYATGIRFPGERSGRLPSKTRLSQVELANLSYGYGLSVTPVQLARMYMTLANDGRSQSLHLVRGEASGAGATVISPKVSRAVAGMMRAVLEEGGTGTLGQPDSYTAAGKTGTVHKHTANGYEKGKYRSVFAGFAPASSPRIAVVVMVDEPRGKSYWGGTVAAPVFRDIAEKSLRFLRVPPDRHTELDYADLDSGLKRHGL
jgi:cell division protein FtsI (penicillin-binding protein 3)